MFVDMDGFMVNGKFHVRELAILPITTDEPCHLAQVFRFDINLENLSRKDEKVVCHIVENVHGLTPKPYRNEPVLKNAKVDEIIKQYYDFFKTKDKDVVVYKGKFGKLQYLENRGMELVDLTDFGCTALRWEAKDFDPIYNCGWHKSLVGGKNRCCAIKTIRQYRYWRMQMGLY